MTPEKLVINHQSPDKIALTDGKQSILYQHLDLTIMNKATLLGGYRCVALAMDNSVDWILWDLAALRNGTVIVPIPPFFSAEQTAHALKSSGCQALITEKGIQSLSYPSVVLPAGTAKVTYTSGSTGTPKGVCLSEQNMAQVAASIVEVLGPDMAGIHSAVLPFGILLENVAGVYAALMAGATIRISGLMLFGTQYADLHERLAEAKATSIILVPEILRALMGQIIRKGPLQDLKFIAVGGSKVSADLILKARALGLPVYEGYGLSECSSVVALNMPAHDQPGMVGKLLPHVRAHILDGEIVIDNPEFLGYLGEPHKGPFLTGDIGTLDENGFLSVTGRRKNILITSYGRNVSPEWVEAGLLAQPEIAQAIVYGDGQPHLGALLVPVKAGLSLDSAVTWANSKMPEYARIEHFEIVPAFTMKDGTLTGNGRPRRDHILATYRKDNTMTFYQRLIKETEPERQALYGVPQLTDGMRGDISRDTYIAYLTEAYHHVKHTVRFMMAMGARLPEDKKWLHDAVSEYIEEEKGHEEWILNDIGAAGGNKEQARIQTPNLETQILVSYNYDYIARKNPVGFLGMVFMLESTSTQIANQGADAVKSKLNLPQSAFTYLYSHGALDIEHLKFFENLVNKIDDPADQDAIIEVARNTFRLFANLMRAIPHERALKNAA